MEAFIGLILVIFTVAFIFFFKPMIKKTGQYADDVVTTNIAEAQTDLIRRSKLAMEKITDEFGEDFETPQEIYNKMMKRKKKESIPIKVKK